MNDWYMIITLKNGLKFCYDHYEDDVLGNFVDWCEHNDLIDGWSSYGIIRETEIENRKDLMKIPCLMGVK